MALIVLHAGLALISWTPDSGGQNRTYVFGHGQSSLIQPGGNGFHIAEIFVLVSDGCARLSDGWPLDTDEIYRL